MTDDAGPSPGKAQSGTPSTGARVSALARASAAVGGLSLLLTCCGGGIGGSIAVVLGIIAIERIRASGGALLGRATAWAGILLGSTSLLLSIALQFGFSAIQRTMNEELDASVQSVFAAVDTAGRDAAVLKLTAPSSTVLTGNLSTPSTKRAGETASADSQPDGSAADASMADASTADASTADASAAALAVGAFATESRRRYGTFEGFSVTSNLPKPSLAGQHGLELAVRFEFSEKVVPGSIIATLSVDPEKWTLAMTIDSIKIGDLERGELSLGPPAATTSEPPKEGTTP